MKKQWYRVSVNFDDGNYMYICQFEKSLKQSVFSKKDNDFIKLQDVRWLNRNKKKKQKIVKLQDYNKDYSNIIYVRKSIIDGIFPLKKKSIF